MAALGLPLLLAACAGGTTAPPSTSAPTASAVVVSPAPPSPTPTAPAPAPAPLTCPPPRPASALPVLVRTGGHPDDVTTAADGTLWVSDVEAGTVTHLDLAGHRLWSARPGGSPEGLVPLADGRLLVALQQPNRVVAIRPPSAAPVTLLDLGRVPAGTGLDGIALDAAHGRILVPDSAAAALRALPLGGGPAVTLATGLGRAVDAAVLPDGSLAVTAEADAGLLRVPAGGGAPTVLAPSLHDLDDVAVAAGAVYVTSLSGETVSAVDPVSGTVHVLATGVADPQGLTVLADGRVAVASSGTGAILAVPGCG